MVHSIITFVFAITIIALISRIRLKEKHNTTLKYFFTELAFESPRWSLVGKNLEYSLSKNDTINYEPADLVRRVCSKIVFSLPDPVAVENILHGCKNIEIRNELKSLLTSFTYRYIFENEDTVITQKKVKEAAQLIVDALNINNCNYEVETIINNAFNLLNEEIRKEYKYKLDHEIHCIVKVNAK